MFWSLFSFPDMKRFISIVLTILPIFIWAQPNYETSSDLVTFLHPFKKGDFQNTPNKQELFDSLQNVSSGITIEIPLRKETYYWPNGKTKFIRYYQGNKPFGIWHFYSETKQEKYSLTINNNKAVLFAYSTNGNIKSEQKFKIDDAHIFTQCKEKRLFPTGAIHALGTRNLVLLANGNKLLENGKWVYYYTNGMIQSKGKYKTGKKIGKWIYYDETGDKESQCFYESGELISQKKF